MNKLTWTPEMKDILKDTYPRLTIDEVCAALPAVSWRSIGRAACRLGLKRPMSAVLGNAAFWTINDNLEKLQKLYPTEPREVVQAAFPDRKWRNITHAASKWKIRRSAGASAQGPQSKHPIIKALRRRRVELNLFVRDVAAAAGICESTITQSEAGYFLPDTINLIAWAESLGMSISIAVTHKPVARQGLTQPAQKKRKNIVKLKMIQTAQKDMEAWKAAEEAKNRGGSLKLRA